MIFLYADLQWATANQCNGKGGCAQVANSAQVGFSAGDGMRYFTLNGSGTDAVLSLNSTSNVGQPGVWIFQVDGVQVVSAGKSVRNMFTLAVDFSKFYASSVIHILCLQLL